MFDLMRRPGFAAGGFLLPAAADTLLARDARGVLPV
jgi:hypothetical protein